MCKNQTIPIFNLSNKYLIISILNAEKHILEPEIFTFVPLFNAGLPIVNLSCFDFFNGRQLMDTYS